MVTHAPTAEEQLQLEFINRARLDPEGEYDNLIANGRGITADIQHAMTFFGTDASLFQSQLSGLDPVAPLAWNSTLAQTSEAHSELMIEFDLQSHRVPGEASLGDRVRDAGYSFASVAENVFAYGQSGLYDHAAFYIDWGAGPGGIQDPAGHRNTILNDRMTEVGIAVIEENNPATSVGPFVATHNFGTRHDYAAQVLGVVINDTDNDAFYDIGEGLGGITVTATRLGGGASQEFVTTTWAAGGYQMVLPNGTFELVFTGAGIDGEVRQTVTMNGENEKIDARAQDATAPAPTPEPEPEPEPEPTPEPVDYGGDVIVGGAADDVLTGTANGDTIAGGEGNDTLLGGDGRDNLAASAGDDSVDGGTGDDSLGGGTGNDTLDGGTGNDVMGGGMDNDLVRGGDGNDIASGGAGNDTMAGDSGADVMGASFGSDSVDGGIGNDNLGGGTGRDTMHGGDGNDTLGGGEGDDTITGGAGDDFIAGGGRDDIIDGGAGADRINAGNGNDTITGGTGDDLFIFNTMEAGAQDVITDFEAGDQIRMGDGASFAALGIANVAGGAQITWDDHVILLEGVAANSLDSGDFVFN